MTEEEDVVGLSDKEVYQFSIEVYYILGIIVKDKDYIIRFCTKKRRLLRVTR